ncbi:MAG: CRISPR system precrRNA processing endoribonuclease RAMP protein Cas6 [Methylosarcina sp.]
MKNQMLAPELPFSVFRFNFSASQPIKLPQYAGSAWRGAFGHALKKTVCIVKNTPCGDCLLKSSCAYSYLFETPPPANTEKMRKYTAAPHPFILQMPLEDSQTSLNYSLQTVVFDHGQRFFPYIVHALKAAGDDGLGGHRQILHLETIEQLFQDSTLPRRVYSEGRLDPLAPPATPEIPDMPARLRLSLRTPMRIKQDSKNINGDHFSFAAFFGNLLRRISMLTYFHTDTPLETDFAALMQRARAIEFAGKNLRWYDWTRYSSRQQTEMHLGGVIGSLELEMQGLEEFWPYLWLGQWTHAGKATSMGMGRYSIEPASLPSA